jgi:hypothetical protein
MTVAWRPAGDEEFRRIHEWQPGEWVRFRPAVSFMTVKLPSGGFGRFGTIPEPLSPIRQVVQSTTHDRDER